MKFIVKLFFTGTFLLAVQTCSLKTSQDPILILAGPANFGTYTAEILKAEGLNAFTLESPDNENINIAYLKQFQLVILAANIIEPALKGSITTYVNSGGNLITFRPDPDLYTMCGIVKGAGIISEGYIRTDPDSEQSAGITKEAIQFHGTADICKLNGASTIASMFQDEKSASEFPAVILNNSGKGRVIAFLYNLPKSIVYTRQGNPLSAGIEKDGIPGLRGMDLFTDGWIDTAKNTLNQADQQMALLTNCIQNLAGEDMPLPRFWYFPDSLACLVVLDNDGEDNKEDDFEQQLSDIDAKGAKMTIYIKDVEKISKAWAEKWTARGFEISGHPDDTREAENPHWDTMDSALRVQNSKIETKFGLPVRTNVNHWFVWCGTDKNGKQDFGAQARLEEKNGIEMDANYALYDIHSNQAENYLGTPGYWQGNYTGSGLVMKYAAASGKTINVYQRFNAVYDQQYNEGSTKEEFFNCFRGLADRSLNNEKYSVVSIKSHNNEYYFSKEPLMKMLDYANRNEVPVWTAVKLLDFLRMKDEAAFTQISWIKGQLSFQLKSSLTHASKLSLLVPVKSGVRKINRISIDGQLCDFIIRKVREKEYALISVDGGKNYEMKVDYHK